MIWIIARREIKDHILSLRFYFAFLLCFVLLVSGTLVLTEEQGRQRQVLEPFLKVDQYREVASYANSAQLIGGGVFLTRPLPALRMLVYGLEDLSLIAQVKGGNYELYLRRPFVDNAINRLFSNFDLVFIVGTLFSLVAIAFTYDAVAGEREQGTLLLILAHGISRGQLLAGKWLGAFLSLLTLLAPCFLAAVALVHTHPLVDLHGADWGILPGLFAGSMLYIAVFISLGLLVSCRCREGRTALLSLLAIWALLIWIVPSFSPYLAARLAPVEPALLIEANISHIRAKAESRGWEEVAGYIRERGWDDRESSTWNLEWGAWSDAIPRLAGELAEPADQRALQDFSTRIMRHQLQDMEERAAQIKGSYLAGQERQADMGRLLGCLSPAGPFAFMLTDLTGTGVGGEFHFRRNVERFKRDLVAYIYRQLEDRSLWDQVDEEDFPYFVYAPGRAWPGAETVAYALLLGLYSTVFFLAAHASFVRSEVD